jgi:myo-inositol-1(or 4)-monophosphatase
LTVGTYMSEILKFAKVRMIGSAAASLVLVAKGAAEAYFERNIMIWDVAAALALVEGAGGCFEYTMSDFRESLTVLATNSAVPFAST